MFCVIFWKFIKLRVSWKLYKISDFRLLIKKLSSIKLTGLWHDVLEEIRIQHHTNLVSNNFSINRLVLVVTTPLNLHKTFFHSILKVLISFMPKNPRNLITHLNFTTNKSSCFSPLCLSSRKTTKNHETLNFQ